MCPAPCDPSSYLCLTSPAGTPPCPKLGLPTCLEPAPGVTCLQRGLLQGRLKDLLVCWAETGAGEAGRAAVRAVPDYLCFRVSTRPPVQVHWPWGGLEAGSLERWWWEKSGLQSPEVPFRQEPGYGWLLAGSVFHLVGGGVSPGIMNLPHPCLLLGYTITFGPQLHFLLEKQTQLSPSPSSAPSLAKQNLLGMASQPGVLFRGSRLLRLCQHQSSPSPHQRQARACRGTRRQKPAVRDPWIPCCRPASPRSGWQGA